MQPQIRRFDAQQEYLSVEHCHINELSNNSGDEAVSIARARVEPGVRTRLHRLHETTERYVILGGFGKVEIGDQPACECGPGDVVLIPPLCPQRITNTGAEDLVFLAICTPRFSQDNYEDIEPSS